jgi:nucleotide-binding universal stress UspA family protein
MKGLPVVVGYDGSAASRKALDWAAEEAARREVPLKIVYADPRPLPLNSVQEAYSAQESASAALTDSDLLADVVRAAKEGTAGLEVESALSTLMPTETLVEYGRGAAMVVVGRRGASGFAALGVGSKALQVATHGHCPTVVVPQEEGMTHGPELDRVVVGVDSAETSAAAIAMAFEEAALIGADLTAVHAWEAPFFDAPGGKGGGIPREVLQGAMGEVVTKEERTLQHALAGYSDMYPDVSVRQMVVHQKPAAALVAASQGARMLVVGTRGRGNVAAMLLGSVSYRVLHQAHCPVAVVRPMSG